MNNLDTLSALTWIGLAIMWIVAVAPFLIEWLT